MAVTKTGTARAGIAGIALAALLGAAVGIGGSTFHYAKGTSYLSNDPEACINCHVMNEQHEGWLHAPHHSVATCNDCHVPADIVGKYLTKIEHGYRHSKAFTFQDFHEPIRITPSSLAVVENNCVRCHADKVSDLVGHGTPAGAHVDAARVTDVSCVHCHQGVAHGWRK